MSTATDGWLICVTLTNSRRTCLTAYFGLDLIVNFLWKVKCFYQILLSVCVARFNQDLFLNAGG